MDLGNLHPDDLDELTTMRIGELDAPLPTGNELTAAMQAAVVAEIAERRAAGDTLVVWRNDGIVHLGPSGTEPPDYSGT